MVLKVHPEILLSVRGFDTFMLTEELFPKALRNHETCLLISNNLIGKLFSSLESPTTLDFQGYISSICYSYFWFIKLRVRQIYL